MATPQAIRAQGLLEGWLDSNLEYLKGWIENEVLDLEDTTVASELRFSELYGDQDINDFMGHFALEVVWSTGQKSKYLVDIQAEVTGGPGE